MTTKSEIVELLLRNDRAVARALVVLYNRQTVDEQQSEETRHLNGIGFTGADAYSGSLTAKYFLKTPCAGARRPATIAS